MAIVWEERAPEIRVKAGLHYLYPGSVPRQKRGRQASQVEADSVAFFSKERPVLVCAEGKNTRRVRRSETYQDRTLIRNYDISAMIFCTARI